MTSPFQNFRRNLAESRRRHAAFRRVRAELEAMSPRELADIGIAPYEISRIAAETARTL